MSEKGRIDCYRYGYQGSEKDDEVKGSGNSYTTEFRMLDPRLGRWLSIDPLAGKFPWQSPYISMDNNPICLTDVSGLSADGEPKMDKKSKREFKRAEEYAEKFNTDPNKELGVFAVMTDYVKGGRYRFKVEIRDYNKGEDIPYDGEYGSGIERTYTLRRVKDFNRSANKVWSLFNEVAPSYKKGGIMYIGVSAPGCKAAGIPKLKIDEEDDSDGKEVSIENDIFPGANGGAANGAFKFFKHPWFRHALDVAEAVNRANANVMQGANVYDHATGGKVNTGSREYYIPHESGHGDSTLVKIHKNGDSTAWDNWRRTGGPDAWGNKRYPLTE